MPRPPQQTSQWPSRVPASRLSREACQDVIRRPATVSGRRYAEDRRANGPIQPEINAYWSFSFPSERTGCRPQPLCQANWPSKMRNKAGVQLPVANGRRKFTIDRKELAVNSGGRLGRQKTDCDRLPVSREISHTVAEPKVKSNNFRNAEKPEPEVEISEPQEDGETSAVAKNNDFADKFASVDGDCSTSRSSRDSARRSITSYNRDDVTQLRGGSVRTSGVFSRMSTEAQQAWIAIKQYETSTTSNDEPETKRSSARAHDTTSGFGVRQTITCDRIAPRDSRRHRAKYTTQETAYIVFEPRSNGRLNSASTFRVVAEPRRGGDAGHDSRAIGNFRITSAAYDSRFVDMALAASQRVKNDCVTGDDDDDDNDDNDDETDAEVRAASVAKCLSWLKTQSCQYKLH